MDSGIGARRFGTAAIIIALMLLGLALVTGRLAHSKGIESATVTAAMVRLPAVPGRPAAGYLTITGGPRDDQLTGISAAAPTRIELHESMMMHGTMSMAKLAIVPVPANVVISFEPAGKHLMIFDLPATAMAGGTLPLTLNFAKAGPVHVSASIRSAGDAMDHAHH